MDQSNSFAMKATLDQISAVQRAVNQITLECHALVNAFNRQFPRGRRPAYLAANPDGSLTALRWRVSQGSFPRFELWDTTGLDLRSKVSPVTWDSWLTYEQKRQDLNRRMALSLYELKRLTNWVDQRKRLNQLSKKPSRAPMPF